MELKMIMGMVVQKNVVDFYSAIRFDNILRMDNVELLKTPTVF